MESSGESITEMLIKELDELVESLKEVLGVLELIEKVSSMEVSGDCESANIDSSKAIHHHFPITRSVSMKDRFVITGTPMMLIDSCNELKPTPTVICPHTAAKLLVQYNLPVKPEILVDVANVSSCPQPLNLQPKIETSPLQFFSPTMVIALFKCEVFRSRLII